jgi:hypothetical protein
MLNSFEDFIKLKKDISKNELTKKISNIEEYILLNDLQFEYILLNKFFKYNKKLYYIYSNIFSNLYKSNLKIFNVDKEIVDQTLIFHQKGCILPENIEKNFLLF